VLPSCFCPPYKGFIQIYNNANAAVEFTAPRETMAVENNVYLAKLAEQAERYEGNTNTTSIAINC
jgi:hypothetical protein